MASDIVHRAALALGRMLRAATYSSVRLDTRDGVVQVWKRRALHAPLLVRLGSPLTRLLDAGIHVLPQREWHEREALLYTQLYGTSVHVEDHGALILPFLPGATLATLLDDDALDRHTQERAIALAVRALADFHHHGFTHADAMAENVMVDLDADIARWFDFETVHEAGRELSWRRADDVRALLATCLLRTPPPHLTRTLHLILDVYGDEDVTRIVAARFDSARRRPLPFHLGQAPLPKSLYRQIGRQLEHRIGR